jgi:hypothetical protein
MTKSFFLRFAEIALPAILVSVAGTRAVTPAGLTVENTSSGGVVTGLLARNAQMMC